MTKIATVTITKEVDIPQPDGVVPAGRVFMLMLSGMQQGPSVPAEFNVPVTLTISVPGVYTVAAARVDTEGNIIASPAESDSFTVAPEQLMMSVPFAITVVLADPVSVPSEVVVA